MPARFWVGFRPRPPQPRREFLDGLGPDGLPYRPKPSPLRRAALVLSGGLCAIVAAAYLLRPDGAAALTVWPVWAWAAPGLLLAVLGTSRATWRFAGAAAVLWVLFALVMSEESRSLVRTKPWPSGDWALARESGRALRVVSLNCAGGLPEAAAEVTVLRPDVVLLQESPSRIEVEALARNLFDNAGGFAWGPDASVIARGEVLPRDVPEDVRMLATHALVRTPSGPEFHAVSLRLLPPLVRADLWNPRAWSEHTDNRRARRTQVQAITRHLGTVPGAAPLLVGGDFNAAQGDAAMRPLQPRLRDAFREGGRGWGNTGMNDIPLWRVDQVWVSQRFRAGAVRAQRTVHSDHRMVVCDLWLQ